MENGEEGISLEEKTIDTDVLAQPDTKLETPEFKVLSAERVKLNELTRLLGADFAKAFSKATVVDIVEDVEFSPDVPSSLYTKTLFDSLKTENLTGGKMRTVGLKEGKSGQERLYAIVEHQILDMDGNPNPGISAMEIFDAGLRSSIATPVDRNLYGCRDILWVNKEGELASFREINQMEDDVSIRIKVGGRKSRTANLGKGIIIEMPSNEERVISAEHELGHRKYAESLGDRSELLKARGAITLLADALDDGREISWQGRTQVSDFSEDMEIFIRDEQEAWRIGGDYVRETIDRGFPIVSGDVEEKVGVISRKHLLTYEDDYKKVCDASGLHFVETG